MRPCAIVPSYNHARVIGAVVAGLRRAGLPVFVIDDGSDAPHRAVIAALHDPGGGVVVERMPVNRGKGAAVMHGFALAVAAGYTHAVQVDADGQHDLGALPALLDLARRHPDALVTGEAVFDDSIPAGRRIGRWITHVWVWIETLSFAIRDSLCGFRVYPLAPVMQVIARHRVGARMDFDIEIMVRLFRAGTPVVGMPVRVVYPPENTSHFDLWRDNLRITWMHTRLVCGLLRPGDGPARHWAALGERGAVWGLEVAALAARVLGRRACLVVLAPAVLWFVATGRAQRRASADFLHRALGRAPGWGGVVRHFFGFAGRSVDVFLGWTKGVPEGAITVLTPGEVAQAAADPRGALILVAHFGNADIARAALDPATRARMTVLVHTRHARNFNRILQRFRPEAALNLVEVTELGPDTAIALKQRIEAGEWVVMAADRVPVGSAGRVCRVPFFGAPAAFSQGPWILAALLGCPVWLLFCVRDGWGWRLSLEAFADRVVLPRVGRAAAVEDHAARYAGRLEAHARQDPWQWYNFYDSWRC